MGVSVGVGTVWRQSISMSIWKPFLNNGWDEIVVAFPMDFRCMLL